VRLMPSAHMPHERDRGEVTQHFMGRAAGASFRNARLDGVIAFDQSWGTNRPVAARPNAFAVMRSSLKRASQPPSQAMSIIERPQTAATPISL
jgi:hypothetical protein